MNYELAKELKDIGFPQGEPNGFPGILNPDADSSVYYPSLSELIETCGDGFKNLDRDTSTEELFWLCNNYMIEGERINSQMTEGKTPEEAVAKLWLALNKK